MEIIKTSREIVKNLLSGYLQGVMSTKEMLNKWPVDNPPGDALLDDICNTFVEMIDEDYSEKEIAELGLKAIQQEWTEKQFDEELDALEEKYRRRRFK